MVAIVPAVFVYMVAMAAAVFVMVAPLPALSAPVETLPERLTRSEQFALGHSNSSLPLEKRISALEKAVFGETHRGNDLARMETIEKFLGSAPSVKKKLASTTNSQSTQQKPAITAGAPQQSATPLTNGTHGKSAEPESEATLPSSDSSTGSASEKPGGSSTSSSPTENPADSKVPSTAKTDASSASSSPTENPADSKVPSTAKTGASSASPSPAEKSGGSDVSTPANQKTDVSANDKPTGTVVQGGVSQTDSDGQPLRLKRDSIASAGGTAKAQTAVLPRLPDLMGQAFDNLNHKNPSEAAHLFDSVTQRDPYNDVAFFQLGNISAHDGNIVDALRNYRIAFNMHPDNKTYQQAVDFMEHQITLRIDPHYHICNYYPRQNDLCSLINQGVRFWGINAVDQSKLLFERVINLDPNNIDGWYDLGAVEERQGHFKQALENYRRALYLYQTPGAERLLSPKEQPMFNPLLPQAYKPFPPMLSSVVTSGEDKQFDLGQQLFEAVAEVSKKAEHEHGNKNSNAADPNNKNSKVAGAGKFVVKLGVGLIGPALLGPPRRQFAGQIDTCDRCQIVRVRIMNAG